MTSSDSTPDPLAPDAAVAVLGAGTMGAGIAHVAAEAGHRVALFDVAPGAVTAALDELRTRLERSASKGRRSVESVAETLARITPATGLDELAGSALVIEAIVEKLEIKRNVFSTLEEILAEDAVIATNTSSLSVTAIAAGLQRPERVVGMHFFNPAPVMPLVEIVSGDATAPAVADLAFGTAVAWGKTPVRCTSTPGFIVNRVARPFYGEGLRLLAEGVANARTIDAVVVGAGGFRMGPFTLMDLVGLDVNLAVSTSVYEQTYHDPRFAPNVIQRGLVDAGRLGRKSGHGFFDYDGSDDEPGDAVQTVTVSFKDDVMPAVEAVGDLGHAGGIVDRLRSADVPVRLGDGDGGPGFLRIGGAVLVPTDGRTATEIMAGGFFGAADVAVVDLVADWADAGHVAMAEARQAQGHPAGPFAGVLQSAGVSTSIVADAPGLVLMRIVAQLANVAADTALLGVADPAAIDTAMRLGTNYPLGPMEWSDRIGAPTVVGVLDATRAFYGEDRYRVSAMLRRIAVGGGSLRGTGGGGTSRSESGTHR